MTKAKERNTDRIFRLHLAEIRSGYKDNKVFFANVVNMAPTGLGITCNFQIRKQTPVALRLFVHNCGTLELSGEVVQSRDLPNEAKYKFMYGVHLDQPCSNYLDYLSSVCSKPSHDRRIKSRFQTIIYVTNASIIRPFFGMVRTISESGGIMTGEQPFTKRKETPVVLFNSVLSPIECEVDILSCYQFNDYRSDFPHGAGFRFSYMGPDDRKTFQEFLRELGESPEDSIPRLLTSK